MNHTDTNNTMQTMADRPTVKPFEEVAEIFWTAAIKDAVDARYPGLRATDSVLCAEAEAKCRRVWEENAERDFGDMPKPDALKARLAAYAGIWLEDPRS